MQSISTQAEPVQIRVIRGADIGPYVADLARLRISVFRAFPYLYDGDLAYERDYISRYSDSPRSLFVLALDGDQVVGVATGVPLADEAEAFKGPFVEAGHNIDEIFYFGESVLLPEYRGRGLGVRFFAERERHAASLGLRVCAFCAVERSADHPQRPADYVPLNDFWHKRGYRHVPQLRTQLSWKDIGDEAESLKPLSFWLRELS
ncbi:GNAT family N-acetyltransferase [Marinobacterium rhizophilum]|uniref:GNAT family N-acetyltransferase n=1 Tax=Marinobacterium rhizophilum TaxID=420402 RepID=UPI002107EBD9|nr:GNAT family N-acetyltransferase [Marinobacterium rhizophilum]